MIIAPSGSLINHISESVDGFDIEESIRNHYMEDRFFKEVAEKPKEFRNFETRNGLIFRKEKGSEYLCIPNIHVLNERSLREIVISHAHSLLAHLGFYKTSQYLRDHVWWKTMIQDVEDFCKSCMTCKRSKPSNQKPYGLLNPLPVPSLPWEAIGIDFVGPLPESQNRDGSFDSITVIIDLLTSMVHLVPS